MKKDLLPITSVLICTSLITGCIKSNEYLQRLDDIGKVCRIKTFTFTGPADPGGATFTATFHYNSYGDADSIVYPPNWDFANLYFRYDNHHRLLDFIYAYPQNDSVLFWFRYFYANEKSERPFVDSLYIFPDQMTHWPPVGNGPAFDTYVYDSLGRMTVWVMEGLDSIYFPYDAHGNTILINQHVVTNDDKVDFNRTNKWFQFLSWDYSVNNPFIANKYNRYGLPTDIGNVGNIQLFRSVIPYSTAKIEYDCSVPKGPVDY